MSEHGWKAVAVLWVAIAVLAAFGGNASATYNALVASLLAFVCSRYERESKA